MSAVWKKLVANKTLSAAAGGFALLLLLTPGAAAQEQGASESPQTHGVRPQEGARGGSLIRRLNLTPEQHLTLREIRRQSETDARPLARRVRLARRALDEAIYADPIDDALVEQRLRELSEAQGALVRLRALTELKVRRVLTPEQLSSFRELRLEAQRRRATQRQNRGGRHPSAPGAPSRAPLEDGAPDDDPGPRLNGPPRPGRRRP